MDQNKSIQELKQKLNRVENFLLISLMFGVPIDMVEKAIEEMKNKDEVKNKVQELINSFNH